MLLFKQLDLFDHAARLLSEGRHSAISISREPMADRHPISHRPRRGRDFILEARAEALLRSLGVRAIASSVRVEWSARLRSAAGRADYRRKLITLNPRLAEHGEEEIVRTFLHELAHLLAQFRAGRRRVQPHGAAWRQACCDVGIPGEARCHSLPFPVQRRARPYLYRCPNCARAFPRVRRVRRRVACLACCRRFNRGRFDARFQLQLVRAGAAA